MEGDLGARAGCQEVHGDSSFARRLAHLARLDLLVIDDFAIAPMGAPERNDLLELVDDRIGPRSTLITSQLPVKAWDTYLNDPTLADAILDRVVHSSHMIELKATRSMRDTAEGAPPAARKGPEDLRSSRAQNHPRHPPHGSRFQAV